MRIDWKWITRCGTTVVGDAVTRSGMLLCLLIGGWVVVTTAAIAAVDPQAVTVRDILAQQLQLRTQVQAGKGAFRDLSKPERDALLDRQQKVMTLLQDVDTVEALRPDQRAAVFNHLEWIKATVARAEDERMLCEHIRTLGSNRKTSVCMSARQQRDLRERIRRSLDRGQLCNTSKLVCMGEEGD